MRRVRFGFSAKQIRLGLLLAFYLRSLFFNFIKGYKLFIKRVGYSAPL